jgi:AAA domain
MLPRLIGGFSGPIQTMHLAEQRDRAAALDQNYLFIQGPPGTGKTWTGARIVVDLIRRGQRVGVAATSHKAIHNLLDEIGKAAMATSSAEDMPRTLDFLFSRNRLNVAVSRAMCLACIVASPRLLESRARTIEQMQLINALCRFAEVAGELGGSIP